MMIITGTVADALDEIGYAGSLKPGAIPFDSFVELHIEQGPVLEIEQKHIGIVEMVQGIYWSRYELVGEANHAGTTPIKYRKDAGYAAAQIMQYVGEYCRKIHNQVLATVGSVKFEPNTVNIVPEKASFTLDLRSTDKEDLKIAQKEIDSFIKGLAKSSKLSLRKEVMVMFEPVHFPQQMVNLIKKAALTHDLTYKRMASGAGHDAQMMSAICPSTMIFIPSVKGISHNLEEYF
jgi:N-carbamoyl-L-amino-acid hydrolase